MENNGSYNGNKGSQVKMVSLSRGSDILAIDSQKWRVSVTTGTLNKIYYQSNKA